MDAYAIDTRMRQRSTTGDLRQHAERVVHVFRRRIPSNSGFADPDAVARDIPGVTLLQKLLEAATLVSAVQAARRER